MFTKRVRAHLGLAKAKSEQVSSLRNSWIAAVTNLLWIRAKTPYILKSFVI
jgi:hypothetical protein